MAYGALGGALWFLIYDSWLCPHGSATFGRHLLAFGIGGSLLAATTYSPSSFFIGFLFGVFAGGMYDNYHNQFVVYPRGYELLLPDHDP